MCVFYGCLICCGIFTGVIFHSANFFSRSLRTLLRHMLAIRFCSATFLNVAIFLPNKWSILTLNNDKVCSFACARPTFLFYFFFFFTFRQTLCAPKWGILFFYYFQFGECASRPLGQTDGHKAVTCNAHRWLLTTFPRLLGSEQSLGYVWKFSPRLYFIFDVSDEQWRALGMFLFARFRFRGTEQCCSPFAGGRAL